MVLRDVAHVAITVTDLQRSKEWYGRVLDWSPVMEGETDSATFSFGALPDGPFLALREHREGSRDAFDPTRTGMDHLAFAAGSAAELADWETRFADLGVPYEPTQVTDYGHVLNFKDPDGVALEIFAAPESQ
jgi:glyoxylase I family protein